MRVLCIGDVVGNIGCRFLRSSLTSIIKAKKIDLVVCNAENSADGNGMTKESAEYLFNSGVDVITLGNHAFRRKEAYNLIENSEFVVRPANFPDGTTPGYGIRTIDMLRYNVAVINLMGLAFMDDSLDCPFKEADKLLKQIDTKIILVDFHAETTGEKRAMGYYLDGRVSAVFGTHTHVQTADEQILPCGTGYITDVGMTGTINSVLGIKPELVIEKLKTKMPVRFDLMSGGCKMDCILFEIDEKTGKTVYLERMGIK